MAVDSEHVYGRHFEELLKVRKNSEMEILKIVRVILNQTKYISGKLKVVATIIWQPRAEDL